MFENKKIGFVSQNTDFLSKKNVVIPFAPFSEENKTIQSSATIDTVQINSLFLKGNNKVGIVNIFSMSSIPSGKEKMAGVVHELPNYKIDDQGNTNSCGTTSLTSVLKYFGSDVKDHWEIDKSIRSTRFDMFTSPGDIVSYAKSKGFKAGLNNNSNVEDIASFIDKGVPVIVLTDPGDQYNFNMHWIVIKGYQRNEKGEIDNLKVADPSGGWDYNKSAAQLKKEWGNIRVGFDELPAVFGGKVSFSTSYNNLMIPIVPKNKIIKTPDGASIHTNSISIPEHLDSVHGYGARIVGKSALLIDRTISLGQKVGHFTSETSSTIAQKLGL